MNCQLTTLRITKCIIHSYMKLYTVETSYKYVQYNTYVDTHSYYKLLCKGQKTVSPRYHHIIQNTRVELINKLSSQMSFHRWFGISQTCPLYVYMITG